MIASRAVRDTIVLERTYAADIEDVWWLWTTKEGFESWWGPEGFRVEVSELDPRVGGTLAYEMIADAEETIAAMESSGNASRHGVRGTFSELVAHRRLGLTSRIDFVPGVEPYDSHVMVELSVHGDEVRMVLTIETMHDALWTKLATDGWESQLTKVPAALAARAGRRLS